MRRFGIDVEFVDVEFVDVEFVDDVGRDEEVVGATRPLT